MILCCTALYYAALCFAMQGFVGGVLDAASVIPQDANKALLIFDDLVTILNVDVNITGMSADVAVSLEPDLCSKGHACRAASLRY